MTDARTLTRVSSRVFRRLTRTSRLFAATMVAATALGLTASGALADYGGSAFYDGTGYVGVLGPPTCNLYYHHASFDVYVQAPTAYPNGVWFSVQAYARDISVGANWVRLGSLTQFKNTQVNGVASVPMTFFHVNADGTAGHTYQFGFLYTWAPPGGYWASWTWVPVGPYTWVFSNGGHISGYQYCRL